MAKNDISFYFFKWMDTAQISVVNLATCLATYIVNDVDASILINEGNS